MPRRALLTLALAALAPIAAADAMSLVALSDNVYAVLQPPGERFNDSNSVIIVGDTRVVVVDAQSRPANVRAVMDFVEQVTDKPVGVVINTHWHGDHTQGNALYRRLYGDDVEIVGHDSLFDDVPQRAAVDLAQRVESVEKAVREAEAQLALGKNRKGEALTADGRVRQREAIDRSRRWLEENRDAQFVLPTIAYKRRMTMRAGPTLIELIHVGAHTDGDTLVYLPNEKILVTGDVLDDLPYVGHGHPGPWLAALRDIGAMDVAVYVPGHGPLFRDDEKLLAIAGFLTALREIVTQARGSGRSLEEAKTLQIPGAREALAGDDPAAQRFFDAVLPEAIERAYEERIP